jgi:NADPH:quinone reductase
MKAVLLKQFGGVENFEFREVENPRMVSGSVRIRIKATAFNPIDYQMRSGGSESKLLESGILGRELSGIITEAAPNAKNFAVGEEVFSYVGSLGSNGTYAEEIVVPEAIVARKPANLTFAQAAAIPLVGLTAVQAIEKYPIDPTDKIFVAGGAGGVGSMIIRLLRLKGAENIFSTAGSDASRNRLLALGLTEEQVFDYTDSQIAEKIETAAAGKMDICLDTVGGKMSEISAEILKIEGVYADITFLTTAPAREMLFNKATIVLNVANYAYGLDRLSPKLNIYGENLNFLRQKIEAGDLPATPIEVVGDLSVESVSKAHTLLERNLTQGKKMVMEITFMCGSSL